MTSNIDLTHKERKACISDIGKILVQENGKKKHYTAEEVSQAHKLSKWVDLSELPSWVMTIFTSKSNFDQYHSEINPSFDYVEMKAEMLSGLSIEETANHLDLPTLDTDISWLDFGEAFEDIFEGIGEFIEGILDGLA